jgi:hypothetical protein
MAQVAPGCLICTADDFHPYECDGRGKCVHCDRRTVKGRHLVSKCGFCQDDKPTPRKAH